jgi:ketosteroid isomerase-like protein
MATFAGRRYHVDDVVEERRGATAEVVVRYRLTASCAGGDIDVPGVMWLQVRDGAIARRIDCWDSLTLLRQTGAAPGD